MITGVELPVEVPGEDVAHPPFGAVPASSHLANRPAPAKVWDDARPDWDDLTTVEHDEHRQDCDLCAWCEQHRAWGDCISCGADVEINDQGLSFCCGSSVVTPAPIIDDLRQVAS